MINRLALSGKFCVGKDFVANACGFRVLSIAKPMYNICSYFFGSCDKTRADHREFLQTIGRWGWGYSDAGEYPVTPERAVFCDMMRRHGREISGLWNVDIDWSLFGLRKDFWIQILLKTFNNENMIAVTNVRYEHEVTPLVKAGFSRYLVCASEETRARRNGGLIPKTVASDLSERFADHLEKEYPDDKIIWNDDAPMPTGHRYLLLQEFVLKTA
jgi:hypothetical protein